MLFSAISCNKKEDSDFDVSLQLDQIGTHFLDTNILDQKRYLAYKQAFDKRLTENGFAKGSVQIPLIIHQVWIENEPIPSKVELFQETWRVAHPDWGFIVWTKDKIATEFPGALVVMEKLDNDQIKQEWLASLILEKMGGVVVSPYSKCYKALTPLHYSHYFYAGLMTPYIKPKQGRRLWIGTDFVGAVPGSPIVTLWRNELEKEIDLKNTRGAKGQLGDVVDRFISEDGVVIYPPTYFYPVAPKFQKRFIKKDKKIKFEKISIKKRLETLFGFEERVPFSTVTSETFALSYEKNHKIGKAL